MFKLEIKDKAEAEAQILQNLTCHIIGIIYKVEEFRSPVSVQQCWNCQNFGHSAKTCKSKTKCLICWESRHHIECPNREKKQPKCANCKGPLVASYKEYPAYKKHEFRQDVVDNQKSYAAILRHSTAPLTPKIRYSHFQPTCEVCSKRGHSSCSATGLLHKFGRTQFTRSQVCVAELHRLPKLT